ncbi:hypothetical protein GT037_003204 [Alternaria burnsii]|uniref:Uncharacterized protein n=1 Tax=Alternaria burnsii TaxID=1187904 RepID=A0A8H7B8X1_9PLEO|nr:uncharacterized protein GT037_003204 [Alternaria burnsii]KAF7679456.1 hypothetical protein GT037_003204 [Alternaria burnsii]
MNPYDYNKASRPTRFSGAPLIEWLSSADRQDERRRIRELAEKNSLLLGWRDVIHPTGWMDPTIAPQTEAEAEEQKVATDEETYRAAHDLVQKGANRASSTNSQPGLKVETPARLKNSKKPLVLKEYQIHTYATLRKDYEDNGKGMILGLEMGTGKTIITLAFLFSIQQKPGTPHLVVVPASLLEMWVKEIEDRLGPVPKYCVYQEDKKRGRTATYTPNQLVQYDIVLVTYEKLQLDAKAYRETRDEFVARHGSTTYWNDPIRCNSTLSVVKWHVIVLEEGHRIVNGESKTTAAACGLRGQYRLALTGTPFQNEYSDFQSLYRFLQIPPWDKVSNFNRFFLFTNKSTTAAQTLPGHVNAILALSIKAHTIRLKTTDEFDGKLIADFKEAIAITVNHTLKFGEASNQQTTRTIWDEVARKQHQENLKAGVPDGSLEGTQSYKEIMKARLAIIHHLCLTYRYGTSEDEDDVANTSQDAVDNRKSLREATKTRWNESSRMRELVKCCKDHRDKYGGPMIIFSDFLSALDVAENALRANFGEDQRIARFDGTVHPQERTRIVDDFQGGRYAFILITTKCGAFGITLTRANGVVHLTPSWNPHQEFQATARANRIGQKAQVYEYHMYAHDSIERKLFKTKRQKVKKANGILDPSDAMLDRMDEVASWDVAKLTKILEDARRETFVAETQGKGRGEEEEEDTDKPA